MESTLGSVRYSCFRQCRLIRLLLLVDWGPRHGNWRRHFLGSVHESNNLGAGVIQRRSQVVEAGRCRGEPGDMRISAVPFLYLLSLIIDNRSELLPFMVGPSTSYVCLPIV